MMERGSAVAAGDPAREQAREAVTGEARRDRRDGRREVRAASAARQPSRWLCACVPAEAEARAEAVPARVCRRPSWQAGHFHAREVGADRAAGRVGRRPTFFPHLPCRTEKVAKTLRSRDLGCTRITPKMRAEDLTSRAESKIYLYFACRRAEGGY